MATRVSPRSNVSSASSSSTSSSRKSYRNPSFSNDRDKHDSDVWVGHNRNSHVTKQIQHDKRGHRGPNLAPAYKSWGNSGSSMTEESESRMSWRSQKQASNSLSNSRDTARSQNIDQQDASYMAYSPQGQRTANMSNRDNANLIGKHFRGHQKSSAVDEPWGFSPQGQSRGHARKDRWNNTNFPAEHGLRVKESGAGSRFEQPQKQNYCTSDNSLHGNMNSSNIGPHSDHTRMQRRESFRHHSSQASMSSHCPGTSGTSMTFLQGSRHQADVSVSAFERGAEVSRTQIHHKGWEVPSQSRTGTSGFGTRLDDFPPLTTGREIEQRYVEVARPLYSGITGPWQNVRAVTGSWADECSDDVPETCDTEAISFNTVYGENWASSNAATPRMSNRNRYSYNGRDVHVADRGRWQRGSLYNPSVSVAADTSISSPNSRKKGPDAEQVQSSRSSLSFGQGFRRSTPISSDERSGQADNVSKERFSSKQEAHFKADKGGQEPVVSKDKVFAEVANIEFSDEVALPFIMGTCEDMCPSKEREQRERLKDLAVFERLNNNPSKTSRELAVKKFCRSFTGVKLAPDDVRPLHVLWSTLQYLLNLLDDSEFSFDVIHNFLFDRTRAIRQELGMQRIANSQAINMYEEIARFHILSEHELNQRRSTRHVSDSHLNLQQLAKSLLSLFDLYKLNQKEKLPNEAEFRAYYVLLNLDSSSDYQADSLSVWLRQCPASLMKSRELKFARTVLRCYRLGNYKGFFKLVQEATFLQSCLMELHFNKVRLHTLLAINQGGYKLHPIPLADIARDLLMKEGDLEELCSLCSLSAGMDSSRDRFLFVKQSQFSAPKELPSYRCPCIISKRPSSYYEEATGLRLKL